MTNLLAERKRCVSGILAPPFQLPVELDTENASLARLQALGGLQVGAIELRVVRPLPRFVTACVERLAMV